MRRAVASNTSFMLDIQDLMMPVLSADIMNSLWWLHVIDCTAWSCPWPETMLNQRSQVPDFFSRCSHIHGLQTEGVVAQTCQIVRKLISYPSHSVNSTCTSGGITRVRQLRDSRSNDKAAKYKRIGRRAIGTGRGPVSCLPPLGLCLLVSMQWRRQGSNGRKRCSCSRRCRRALW